MVTKQEVYIYIYIYIYIYHLLGLRLYAMNSN
jgi:hypothetical protein